MIVTRAWYTLKEACDLKGVPYSTVRHNPTCRPWAGQVVGGRVRYSKAVVIGWLPLNDEDCAAKWEEQA